MAQSLPRFCPRCGTETIPDQKFCSKCGLDMSDEALKPPTQSSEQSVAQLSRQVLEPAPNPSSHVEVKSESNPSSHAGIKSRSHLPSPVPKRPLAQATSPTSEPPSTRVSRPTLEPLRETSHDVLEFLPTQMLPKSQVQGPPPSSMQTPVQSEPQSPSDHSAVIKPVSLPEDDALEFLPTQMLPKSQVQGSPRSYPRTRMQSVSQFLSALPTRRLGMRRVATLLLLLVIIGGVGIVGIVALVRLLTAPRQTSITTTTLGNSVNYAGVDITVVNAQKSQLFLDDPNSTSNGMLRLQLRAQNKTSLALNLPYETIAHLTLLGGNPVGQADRLLSPAYVKSAAPLAPNATESDLVDFAVPQDVGVDQLIFHLGRVDEAQIDIPLNGHANVDQYASKTIHPNQSTSYAGLNWTLTDASLQFHIDGQQARKGMRYLILTLKVDNPLFEQVIPGSPDSYVHLQGNNASINLNDSTLPVSFEAGVSGKSGTLTFLVPQDNTSFALTFSNPSDGFAVSNTINFQF